MTADPTPKRPDEALSEREYMAIDVAAHMLERLKSERDAAIREVGKYARQAGEAQGRLEMSETAGVVDGWRERAEAAEARCAEMAERLCRVEDDVLRSIDGAFADNAKRIKEAFKKRRGGLTQEGEHMVYVNHNAWARALKAVRAALAQHPDTPESEG